MDPLTQLLMERQLAAQPQTQNPTMPMGSMGKTHTPPQAQRFLTAQKMMDAYRQNWTPNPMLIQATSK
jgi:hypothetical protein